MTKTLDQAIQENRSRWHRRRRAERLIREIRLKTFDYEDAGTWERAQRVIERLASYGGLWGRKRAK